MENPSLLHRESTQRIIDVFWQIVRELGTGFPERIYSRALLIALPEAGLQVASGTPVTIYFRGRPIGTFCHDLIVEGCVLLELKATNTIEARHDAQVLGYLRASALEVALILNFGMHPSVRRLVMTNDRKALPPGTDHTDKPGALSQGSHG